MAGRFAPVDLASIAAGMGGFVIHGEDAGDYAGSSVASAGDVNGDGFADLIIGAQFGDGDSNAKPLAGDSYVVFGKAAGFGAAIDLSSVAAGLGGFVLRGEDAFDSSGFSVASAGDVNGDGFDDLIIGAPGDRGVGNAKFGAGASYVLFGKAAGFAPAVPLASLAAGEGGFVIHGEDGGDLSGSSVASAGDVNGDGFGDLIIGAPQANGAGNAKFLAGDSYVVFGKAGGFGAALELGAIAAGTGGFVIHGEDAQDYSGWSVASAGDVNGDGFDDMIIGALPSDPAGDALYRAGLSYVVFGQAGGFGAAIELSSVAAGQGGFVLLGENARDWSGTSVASAGDVNGDGFDDVIIGARYADAEGNTRYDAGGAYVVFGRPDDFDASIDLATIASGTGGFAIFGQNPRDFAGWSVAGAGDVNGDGLADLIIGARAGDAAGNAKTSAGDSFVVFGKAAGLGASIDLADIAAGRGGFVVHGQDRADNSGFAVASAGDLDGDGFDDLVIGAPFAAGAGNAQSLAGDSYVIFGGAFQPGPAGSAGDDSLVGGGGAQGIEGLAGNDTLRGQDGGDTLAGGGGDDRLVGARGADVLSGGAGNDRFLFDDNALGWTDRILDFHHAEGDRIVLRAIDAIASTAEDDGFTLVGTVGFTHTAGELRWDDFGRGVQRIEGDVDGDGVADLTIDVVNADPVTADWFAL